MGTHTADDRRSTVSVGVRRLGRWTIVEVQGELDIQAGAPLADLLRSNASHVVFDLHGVTFMDACGLSLLCVSRRNAVTAGGCVRLVTPSSEAHRLLTMTGSSRAFPRFHSLLEAVTAPVTGASERVS